MPARRARARCPRVRPARNRLLAQLRRQEGQSSVEAALAMGLFVFAFFVFIQLGLIAMAKHELNHLAFNTARIWSMKANNDQEDLDVALGNVTRVYRHSRGDAGSLWLQLPNAVLEGRDLGEPKITTFMANTLQARVVSTPSPGIEFNGWIPLLIPGVANAIIDELDKGVLGLPLCTREFPNVPGPLGPGQALAACWSDRLDLPTDRAVPVRIFIPIEPEPTLDPGAGERHAFVRECGGEEEPPCFDNDDI